MRSCSAFIFFTEVDQHIPVNNNSKNLIFENVKIFDISRENDPLKCSSIYFIIAFLLLFPSYSCYSFIITTLTISFSSPSLSLYSSSYNFSPHLSPSPPSPAIIDDACSNRERQTTVPSVLHHDT